MVGHRGMLWQYKNCRQLLTAYVYIIIFIIIVVDGVFFFLLSKAFTVINLDAVLYYD